MSLLCSLEKPAHVHGRLEELGKNPVSYCHVRFVRSRASEASDGAPPAFSSKRKWSEETFRGGGDSLASSVMLIRPMESSPPRLPPIQLTTSLMTHSPLMTPPASPDFSSSLQDEFRPPSAPYLSSPGPSIRKSISVDSFVKYGRSASPSRSQQPPPRNDYSAQNMRSGAQTTATISWNDRDRVLGYDPAARGRQSVYGDRREEGDFHPDRAATRPRDSTRPASASASTPNPASNSRSSQLYLPSRLNKQASGPTLRTNNTPRESPKPLPPTAFSSPLSRNPSFVDQRDTAGFSRGSLDLLQTQPRVSQPSEPTSHARQSFTPDVSVAFIGSVGCGKSTLIRKALKTYTLTDASGGAAAAPGPEVPFRFSFHLARVPKSHGLTERVVRVMEVDTSVLDLSSGSVWPPTAPRLDGVFLAYDASNEATFADMKQLLDAFKDMKLPLVVVACKSDLERRVSSYQVSTTLQEYDAGLVEVSAVTEAGKEKIRLAFDWLVKAVSRGRRSSVWTENVGGYRNPASPEVLYERPPWESARSEQTTPTPATIAAMSAGLPKMPANLPGDASMSPSTFGTSRDRTSALPSPTRARSMNDLVAEHERARTKEREKQRELERKNSMSTDQNGAGLANYGSSSSSLMSAGQSLMSTGLPVASADGSTSLEDIVEVKQERSEREPRPPHWGTIDELAYKLVYVAVSGDDPTYISHFLITYRRFATPRSILLAMQKRLRELDSQAAGDPMFAAYAQMRICHLLEIWIRDYPNDFAVRTTAGALSALIKSILTKTHLLHYGSDFLPFLEVLPNLLDKDASWAMKPDSPDDNDDSYSMDEDEEELTTPATADTDSSYGHPTGFYATADPRQRSSGSSLAKRMRKSSLPLNYKAITNNNPPASPSSSGPIQPEPASNHHRSILNNLVRMSQDLALIEPSDVAQEITRLQSKLFLDIEPRHWLQHTLASGSKPELDPIARFNAWAENIGRWVSSLILCHDKAKFRAKQVEKFVDIAKELRQLHNYSALRAVIAGINIATFQGDLTMEIFVRRSEQRWKLLQSYDSLLQSIRSHRAYRMALRATRGAAIPALEVHISDLIRSHEGNPDVHPTDPTKIHWAKWNMMAKFIGTITDCQNRCRTSSDYDFESRTMISTMWIKDQLMDEELQRSRIVPPPDQDGDRPPVLRTSSKEIPSHTNQGGRGRKIKLW